MKKWKIIMFAKDDDENQKSIYVTDDLNSDEADFLPDAESHLLPSVIFHADLPKEFPVERYFILQPEK